MAEPVHGCLRTLHETLTPDDFNPLQSSHGFTLLVNNYAARAVVPALCRNVADAAPNVTVDVRPLGTLDVLDQLDAGGADAAITKLVDGGERFKYVRITDDGFVALFDRQHPAADHNELSLERLAEIPHIAVTPNGDDTSFVDEALEAHGLTRKIAIRVPFLSIVLMLVGSDRLAVVPRRPANGLAGACPLVVRELPLASPRTTLSMIWHRRLDNHPAQRWPRSMIRASVQD